MSGKAKGQEMIAYITANPKRVLGGSLLILHGSDEKECKQLSVDLAKSMKCDVIQMHCGDYLLVKYYA